MQNTLYMLLGAALVALGVLAAALADRIRGLRISREAAPRERAPRAPSVAALQERQPPPVVELQRATMPKTPKAARTEQKTTNDGGDDVIAALVAAGYKKLTATEATWACSAVERTTVESWTASALRRCARCSLS
jgi:hypothetical protein